MVNMESSSHHSHTAHANGNANLRPDADGGLIQNSVTDTDSMTQESNIAIHHPAKTLAGSCACGGVTYISTAPAEQMDFCYCRQDQQLSGAPFVAWIGLPKAALTWHGDITTFSLSGLAQRSCCANCGGTLTIQYDCYPDKTHVAAGTVTRSDWALPNVTTHLFVKFRPSWYEIPIDGVPQYDEFDDEFERVLGEWNEKQGK